ncbi:YadA-like family protein [Haemophilus haemolyticus]|uniref:YadA-like family protein n=1 Tax=Haemophilus haemolyticus TaxID=726 RepID=UPI000E5907B6|nr:YadA-like family protein [Haemophilus haemolyticus]
MNKIFRIVWSQATQSWVVVSELTKAHKKQSSSNSQGSAVKFSGNFIKSSAIALTLLSGHSAYAATAGNTAGEGHTNAVAFGPSSNASQDGAVALGKQAIATGTEGAALGKGAKAQGNLSVAVGVNAQASANNAMALGLESKATQESAVALGFKSKATSFNTVALGTKTDAAGQRSMAFGNEAKATANDTIAIGASSVANKLNDIIIGKEAKSRDEGGGHSVAVGYNATAGSSKTGAATDVTSTGKNTAAGGVAIGVSSYTGLNRNNAAINSSVAIGAGAGAGFRAINADGIPTGNGTDPDDNATVLSKAFGNTPTEAGNKDEANRFNYKGVDINEGTAVGRNTRAIGDQAVALGAQSIAGQGAIAIGGNDITQFANARYFMSNKDNFGVADVSDHDQSGTLASKNISQKYQELVGAALNTAYQATYAQNGSTVIGMQAHSTTPLGVAIGTNALVRKGAYGATAIGSGSAIQANAEAAVAIGMGSWVNGKFGVAAGTASRAEQSAVAAGYKANADKSAVAVGDSSKATNSSVAVGQLAQATKEADIAVGQGAKASGNQGAIAMGLGTNAQGDSSIMIGGANIDSASKQNTTYEKGNGKISTKTVTEIINGHPVQREYSFAGTTTTNGTVAQAYKELTGRDMNIEALNFADNKYKNGHASTSLGVHALSRGDLGTAIGASSRADAIGSVALGVGAKATKQNAVAIGTGSTTELVGTRQLSVSYDKDGNIVDDNSPEKAYTFNWAGGINTSEGDVVSFGSSGAERQLKNVAAGRVADDSTDAINGSQLNSIAKKVAYGWNIAGDNKKQTASVGSEDQVNFVNGNGTTVTVTKQEEVKNGNTVTTPKGANVKFDIKAEDGSIASTANGISVNTDGDTIGKTADGKLKANTGTINTGDDGKAAPNTGDGSKLATVDTVVNAVNNAAWKATAGKDGSGKETGKSEEKIKAGDLVTFKAGDNLAIKQAGKDFIYSLNPVLTGLTSATFTNAAGDTTVIDGNGMTITPKDASANPVSLTKDGLDNGGKTIKNVTSGLTNYPAGTPKDGLVDLSKPATGNPAVPDTTAATVGDLRNMGWVVSSDKTTGELTKAYTDQVKNADEVKFVGEGGVTVSGKTENGVRTITVKAEAQEMPEQPVSYTTADGTKVYPKTVTKPDGSKETKYYPNPDGTGTEIPKENVIASINGPEGTKAPTTLSNVAGNLDGAKKDTKAPTTEHAPVNTTDAKGPNYVNPNNAATVGDVLNAGWNLQNNGTAKDFVKPYDTVNFVNGANTTAVVTTAANGTTSNVTYNVTGLPVTFTDKDGKPVAKVGDKYYPVNEKGQPVTPDGKPAVKTNEEGKPVTEDGTVIEPIDTAANPLKSNLVNPNVVNSEAAPNNQTTSPTQLGNVANGAKTFAPVDNKVLANDGKWYSATDVKPNGAPKDGVNPVDKPATVGKEGLIDFSNSNPNNAATVGDLQNMGWVVSAQGNNYSDQVRNANEVKFVGEGTATVTGKTDENGVRTITVKVNDQASANNAVSPVVYTDENGDRVYPTGEKDPQGNPIFKKNADGTGDIVTGPVKTSINGPKGTKTPATLDNVKNNIPTVNDADKKAYDVDGNPIDGKNNKAAPITAADAADLLNPTKNGKPNPNFAGNNAATVSDVLNAGWNLQGNGSAVDFVKPFDTVNFVNGKGTKAVVETANNLTSTVKFDVDAGEITADETKPGAVKGPVTADEAKKLADDLANAQNAVNNLAPDADDVAKKKAQDALKAAQDAAAPLNKVATAQNVADMINNSGFTLKADETDGKNETTDATLKKDGELIKPGSTVTMKAGKNMTVKHEASGNITYATKDDVEFNTVTVGKPAEVYTNKDGKPLTKTKDGKYTDPDGNEVPEKDVVTSNVSPVKLATEKAIPADNNQDGKAPTTALNVTSTDGKPTQITGVGSVLSNESIPTNTNGTPTAQDKQPKLVNLEGKKDPKTGKVTEPLSDETLNSAATVRDLANMGWIVGAPENGYVDTVKNANKVDFKGENGISVTGKTNDKGVREITISVKDGEVVKPNQFIAKVNGKDTPVTKVGDQYYNTADIDPKTGEPKTDPKANVTPVTPDEGTTPTNAGDGYVTGNKVATAIQKSGFVVGKQTEKLSATDFNDKDEKVNPDDELRFADGNNTKVKLATKESVDKDGNKVTTTTVKVDVTGLPVQYTDKNGTPVTKVGDQYFTVDDKGNPTTTEVKPADLTTNMVNPAAAPNKIGTPTTLGNVEGNLDGAKTGTTAPTDSHAAPNTTNKNGDKYINPNNAATVGDVLNAGWNLQNNGAARDFVKPYDTVNFINGKGTVAVVETADDASSSTVKFDVDAGEITAETKDGKATGKVVGPVPADKKPADLLKAVADAQKAVDELAKDAAATPEAKKAAQDALKAAQDAAAPLNKVATAQNVADMINASGFTLKTSATAEGKKDDASTDAEVINPGKAVEMVAGKNLTVKQEANGKVTYATKDDVQFNSVQFGDKGPKITNKDGNINVSGPDGKTPTKITGVAPGEISSTSKDAVNGSQLHAVASSIGNLNNKINKVGKHADAGTASALAASNIPQAYTPGKSLVGIAAGSYQGQTGVAVGMSRISDNGKIIIRLSGTTNTQGRAGVAAGVGYQW